LTQVRLLVVATSLAFAGATAVELRLDMPNFAVEVRDNGGGISASDFDALGKRHRNWPLLARFS
jgi:hypothetical protein